MTDVRFECQLDALDTSERLRYAALRTAMKPAVWETRELPDGYAVRLTSEPALFRQVAEWIVLERRCCPFLALGLDWSEGDAVWLRLTGRPGVKVFLAEWLAGRPRRQPSGRSEPERGGPALGFQELLIPARHQDDR